MPAAVIGGAIAAVGSVGSAVIASKGASKAARATQQAADQSAAVIRENYDKSAAALAPWQSGGLAANSAINALLGINTQRPAGQITQQPYYGFGENEAGVGSLGGYGGGRQRPLGAFYNQQQSPSPQTQQQSYEQAFDNYRNSTGYQFRLDQGLNAINSGYAGAGAIKSGAAMKAISDYGQGIASQEFGNYLAALGNQQSLGFGAASAQAGVSQNLGNSLANIYTNQGNNLANAALVKSQNSANALNQVFSLGGSVLGRTYNPYSNAAALTPSVAATMAANPGIF